MKTGIAGNEMISGVRRIRVIGLRDELEERRRGGGRVDMADED